MKDKAGLYAKNSLIILIGRVVEFAFGIASVILVARYLGAEQFGAYAFIRGVGIIITPIIGFGGHMVLMREYSLNKEKTPVFLSSSFILQALISFFVLLIATAIFLFRETRPDIITGTYLIIIAQSVAIYFKSVSLVFIAHEKVIYDSCISILIRMLSLLFFVIVVFMDLKMSGLFSAIIAANFIGFLAALFLLARNFFMPKFLLNVQVIFFLLKESWTLIISTLIVHGYMNINLFLLKAFSSLTEISFYQIPQRLIEPLKMIPRAIITSLMPAFSLLGATEESRKELLSAYNTILKYIMVVFFPICVFAVIYAAPVISLFFGEEFLGSVMPLQINIWIIIAFFIIVMSENILTALMKQRVLMITNGFCLLVSSLLGIYLVPRYAAVGASVAMVCGLYSLFFLNWYFISKYLGKIKLFSSAVWPVICGLIMWIFMNSFVDNIHVIFLFPLAVAIYIALLIALKTFTAQEVELFRNLFRKILNRVGLSKEGYV